MILAIFISFILIYVIVLGYFHQKEKYKKRQRKNRDYILGEFRKIMKGDKK